ncbi:MAG: MASE3 domain-containing protein, partial [Candidatus Caldatribacteriaceae bacterium]
MVFRGKRVFLFGAGGVILVLLFFLSRRNYLLFHSLVELLAILTGFSMFLFAFATAPFSSNTVVQKLGWLYLAVASVDILHTLSYKGMGVFPGYTANLPTQFWILGRFLESGGLATIVLFPRRISMRVLALGATVFAFLGIEMIFQGVFPTCFLEGQGLTLFKVVSEYCLIALFFALSIRIKKTTDASLIPFRGSIFWALLWSALAEFSFTLYTDVYGFFNTLGHLFRFLSYFVLLQGILVESIRKPFDILLSEVQHERERLEEVAKHDA